MGFSDCIKTHQHTPRIPSDLTPKAAVAYMSHSIAQLQSKPTQLPRPYACGLGQDQQLLTNIEMDMI